MDYIEINDPEWLGKMMVLVDEAKSIQTEDIHPWVGMVVCSTKNVLCTARVVSVGETMACLDFGWDCDRSRHWSCSRDHLNKHYRVL